MPQQKTAYPKKSNVFHLIIASVKRLTNVRQVTLTSMFWLVFYAGVLWSISFIQLRPTLGSEETEQSLGQPITICRFSPDLHIHMTNKELYFQEPYWWVAPQVIVNINVTEVWEKFSFSPLCLESSHFSYETALCL